MYINDVAICSAKRQVILRDGSINNYGSQQPATVNSAARCALVLHSPPMFQTILPREFVEVDLSSDTSPDSEYTLEPHTDASSVRSLSPA